MSNMQVSSCFSLFLLICCCFVVISSWNLVIVNAQSSCLNSSCLYNTICSKVTNRCDCSSLGFQGVTNEFGPQCQILKRSFLKSGTFFIDKKLSYQIPLVISLEFLTDYDVSKSEVILFADNKQVNPQQWIRIGLRDNLLRLSRFDGGSDERALQKKTNLNKWQQIHFIIEEKRFVLVLNRCSNPITDDCTLTNNDISGWNYTDFFIHLGGNPNDPETFFQGCIKNVYINNGLISLMNTTAPNDGSTGCSYEEKSCSTGCASGSCIGRYDGNGLNVCNCWPGFLQNARESPCNEETTAFYLNKTLGNQWDISDALWNTLRTTYPKNDVLWTDSTVWLILSFRFRTRSNKANIILFQTKERGDLLFSLIDGILKVDLQNVHISFNETTVSDGSWHSIEYSLMGPTIEIKLDDGVGKNYVFYYFESIFLEKDKRDKTDITVSAIQIGTNIIINNSSSQISESFDGCLDDIRLFATSISRNVGLPTCASNVCGMKNTCSNDTVCADAIWPSAYECRTQQMCKAAGKECKNGICEWNVEKKNHLCNCEGSEFTGERCDVPKLAEAGFAWYWILLIILLILLLILIILLICFMFCYRKNKTRQSPPPRPPPSQIPKEKMGGHTNQGAEEEDFVGPIDFNLIGKSPTANSPINFIPMRSLSPATHLGKPPPIPMGNNPNLPNKPKTDEFDARKDYPLEYGFEGVHDDRQLSSSLSSIVSDDDDNGQQEMPPVNNWGPGFQNLSTILK